MINKKIIIGNWKMHNAKISNSYFVEKLTSEIIKRKHFNESSNLYFPNIVICPPFTAILDLKNLTRDNDFIDLGAQDCCAFNSEDGAFTGDISAKMIFDLGCKYVIIGHSERRKYHNEGAEILSKKITSALSVGLKVIYCIGESQEQKENSLTEYELSKQLESIMHVEKEHIEKEHIEKEHIEKEHSLCNSNFIVAYEPIWSIGANITPDAKQINDIHSFIKNKFVEKNFKIVYGGSVSTVNAEDILSYPYIDGILVGRASLDAQEFINIINVIK